MAPPYRTGASLTVSQSPLATFAQTLPDTILSFIQLNQQMEWNSVEKALDREFKTEQNKLAMLNEESRFLREKKFDLMDQLKGYNIPEEITQAGSNLLDGTLAGYDKTIESTTSDIDALYESLNVIESGKQYAKTVSSQYGAAIKAEEDELFKDYMVEGGITVGEGGKLIGTSEMAILLEDLRKNDPAQLEKLKGENYRQALFSSLRTIEEAKQLSAIDMNMKAAVSAQRERDYAFSVQQYQESEKNIFEIFKQVGLATKANFRYNSSEGSYTLYDLQLLAAGEPKDFIDIKNAFLKENYAISAEAESFISGIQQAAAEGIDNSQFVARFQKSAYDDYVKLEEYWDQLEAEGKDDGRTMQEVYKDMPDNATKQSIKRLQKKVEGYKKLGLYRAGFEMLNRSSAVVNLYNTMQADRLAMEMDDAERIAEEGLGLPPIEDMYPSNLMSNKEKLDLEIALAATAASSERPADPNKVPQTLGEKAMTIPAVKALGWTADKFNQLLYNLGADIYNVAGVPMNYLTYLASGYNPGFKGTEAMDMLLGWTGVGQERTFAGRHPNISFLQEMGPISMFGSPLTPRGEWAQHQGIKAIEDSLDIIKRDSLGPVKLK